MQTDYSYELPPILDSSSDMEYERLIDHHTGVNRNQAPDIPLRLYLLHSFWGVGRNELRKTLNSHGNSQKVFLFSSLSNLQRVQQTSEPINKTPSYCGRKRWRRFPLNFDRLHSKTSYLHKLQKQERHGILRKLILRRDEKIVLSWMNTLKDG